MARVPSSTMRGLALAPLVLAACFKPAPQAGAPCNDLGECPSGLSCIDNVCVTGPGSGPQPDACPGARCEGDTVVNCDGSVSQCPLGCSLDGGPHCLQLVPSNGVTVDLLDGVTGSLMADKLSFDTGSGQIRRQATIIRNGGEGLVDGVGFHIIDGMAVWSALVFTLPPGEEWTFTNDHAVVLFAATTITVEGTLDLGANNAARGPGGNNGGQNATAVPCRGSAGKAFAVGFGEGGGGGGGETAGGNGAPSNQTTFGSGGSQCSQPSAIPLRGGNGGGAGGFDGSLRGGAGGGGGGALALVAMLGITIDNATIGAPGAGGLSGAAGDGGGGGGSGGAIMLETPFLIVDDSALTANGGGGAAGRASAGARGNLGSESTAAGGNFNGALGGRGGAGTTPPTNGQNFNDGATNTISVGGGGGGAAGRIVFRTISASTTNTVVSPPASSSGIDVH